MIQYKPILLLLLFPVILTAQRTDSRSSLNNINTKSYVRLFYDNDFFTNRDYYYTQGIGLEYYHPSLSKSFFHRLLIHAKETNSKTGIGIDLLGYTPTRINSDTILTGDRPFAGCIMINMAGISVNSYKRLRVSKGIYFGVIGPAALGKEIQTTIHRATGNRIPKGWSFQVRNDVIINYQLELEKNLLATRPFLLNGIASARIGTLENKISAGINFMGGIYNDPFSGNSKRKTCIYLFGQARTELIGYDASLQGGLLNRSSPYVISSATINRLVYRTDAGLVFRTGNVSFRYQQSFLSKEFKTGRYHRWGGLNASLGF